MIHRFINAIGGVSMLDVISICLFFAVFGGALIFAFCLKKPFLNSMETLPLENSEPAPTKERSQKI